jgi:hypothetical protein
MKRLLVTLLILASMSSARSAAAQEPPAGNRLAFLVGVKQYKPTELRNLKYAEDDVASLATVLTAGGYKPENVVLMTQAEGAKDARRLPTAENIRKELKLILEGRAAEDVVLLAFAGHGVQFSGSDENFFCPMDAELARQETLVSLKSVYAELEKCPAKLKLLLVDACRNDPQKNLARAGDEIKLESLTRPPQDVPAEGIAAFYSCSATQKAYEDDDLKHGVFFHFVVEGLSGRAARPDQSAVHLGDLQFYVNSSVEPFVRSKLSQKQLPQLICKTQGSTPPLVMWPKPPASSAPSSSPAYDPRGLPGAVGPTDRVNLPGYATKGHTIKRLWAFNQLTNHRPADAPKYAPELIAISGDGSRIAIWAPQSGLYTMNHDGSDYKLILPNDPSRPTPVYGRFLMSHDGRYVFWQGTFNSIYRVNADGSGDLRELVKSGAEYTPLRLRWWGNRIYYGTRGGIYSIDTEGVGDYREILTQKDLYKVFNLPDLLFTEFDISETGERLVMSLYDPDLRRRQLFAMPVGGDPTRDLRLVCETDFEPTNIAISPDGSRILFGYGGSRMHLVNWDGSGKREARIPVLRSTEAPQFTTDGRWVTYLMPDYGSIIVNLDTSEIIDTVQTGDWTGNELTMMIYSSPVVFSTDLRRFAYIQNYFGGPMPRQIVAGELNPAKLEGWPALSDIEFPKSLALKPELPNHFGTLKVKASKAQREIERVQFIPTTGLRYNPAFTRFEGDVWRGLAGGMRLNDSGMDGDAQAGDGVWSTANFGKPYPQTMEPKHYLLRIVAHEKTTFRGFEKARAVVLDVDGFDVK